MVAGVVSIFKPLAVLRIPSRKMGAVVLGGGVVLFLLGSSMAGSSPKSTSSGTTAPSNDIASDPKAESQQSEDHPPSGEGQKPGTEPSKSASEEQQVVQVPRLPGLAPVDIYLSLQASPYNFKFGGWTGQNLKMKCGKRFDSDTGADLDICINGSSVSDVVWLNASVLGPDLSAAEWFLPYVATAPFEGNDPKAASEWVKQTWRQVEREGQVFTKEIGPAVFELFGNGKGAIFLKVNPAKGLDEWLATLP